MRRAPLLALVLVACALGARTDAAAAPAVPAATVAPASATVAAPSSGLPRLPPPKDLPRDRPLRAAVVVVDGVFGSELVAAFDVLQHTTAHVRPGIDPFAVSPDGNPVKTAEGLGVAARYSFASAPAVDILVLPGGAHDLDSSLGDEALVGWLAKAGKTARYVVGLRDAPFVLARAGLLQGRLATVFADDQDRFTQMFPKLELRRGVSFVHDGPLLTSIGGARSYDAALYLVDHLFGEEVAKGVAKGLVLPWPPDAEEPPLPALVVRYNEIKK